MDLTLLRSFLAVYRTGSFTKAARQLGMTQPAVTGQIRSLEKQLDLLLFQRTSRGASPTQAADELALDAATHLDALEAAVQRRTAPDQLDDRTLHLGGPAELLATRVLPALAELINDGLRVRVTIGLAQDLIEALAASVLDLVVATVPPRRRDIAIAPIMDEEFCLAASPRWAENITADVIEMLGAAALSDVPLIAYADNLPLINRYWSTVFNTTPECGAQVIVPDLRAVVSLVRAGGGISVLPTYLCQDDLDRGDLVLLHHPPLPPINTLFLANRSGRPQSAVLAAVNARLLEAAKIWQ